jgi:probable HAF family extracellular repeat protein
MMRFSYKFRLSLVFMFIFLVNVLPSNAATFQGLGRLPGASYAKNAVQNISNDGSTIVGYCWISGYSGGHDFYWTAGTGIVYLGNRVIPHAVSEDGTVIGGKYWDNPFRWTYDTGIVTISGYGAVNGIDASGSVLVGRIYSITDAIRWRFEDVLYTDMLGLLPGGSWSGATAVSADGSVVVGVGTSSASHYREAFRWTTSDSIVGLGFLPGATYLTSSATAVSSDGSVVVGTAASPIGVYEAFRWTETSGMVGLGDLLGGNYYSEGFDVSADGNVVVGSGHTSSGIEPIIWDPENGMQNINELLTNAGVDLTGWDLRAADCVSGDGCTVAGIGINPEGDFEPWIATISIEPVDLLNELIQDVIDLNLQQGISNSLDSKLDAVKQALDDVNENNDGAAVNALGAFINAINAQRGSKISEEDADALIEKTQQIIDLLTNG